MITVKQFAAWREIADDDAEFASEVLKWIHVIKYPQTPEEALQNLLSDDHELEGYGVAHPVYGMPEDAAKKILEIA